MTACETCGKPTGMREIVDLGHVWRFPRGPCSCWVKRREAAERESEKARNIERQFASGLTKRQVKFAMNALYSELNGQAERGWDAVSKSRWCLLAGPTGSGKTHVAIAMLNRWLMAYEEGSAHFRKWRELLSEFMDTFSNSASSLQYLRQFKRCGLLVIDDLGSSHDKDFARGVLLDVLDARYDADLPTVLTTNLSFDTLAAPNSRGSLETAIDPRTASRLIGRADVIEFPKSDFRYLERE
jgi:DNA replication protein DnaC